LNLDALYTKGEQAESAALAAAVRLGPWLGPIPTGYLIYNRTQAHLRWPWWVAAVAGLTLELLGVSAALVTLRFWAYNGERLKRKEQPAPTWIPAILTGVYFIAAVMLTVALDIFTIPRRQWQAANFAPVAFPLLSLASVLLLALRAAHAGAFMSKAERKAEREIEDARLTAQVVEASGQMPAQSAPQPAPSPVVAISRNGHERSFEEFERAVVAGDLPIAAMTGETVAEWAGRSASTGRRWKRKLEDSTDI